MFICMIQPIFTFDKLLQRLQLGKEVTPFVIWRENDLFGTHDNPVKIDIPCLFLCLDGEMQLDINLQSYRFNREHLLCFIAPCACRIVSRSPGFRCVGLFQIFLEAACFSRTYLGKDCDTWCFHCRQWWWARAVDSLLRAPMSLRRCSWFERFRRYSLSAHPGYVLSST